MQAHAVEDVNNEDQPQEEIDNEEQVYVLQF